MSRLCPAAALLLAAWLCGCLSYKSAHMPPGPRFGLLEERRLGAFQQRMHAEVATGSADAWTEVGLAWLDLTACRPVAPASDDLGRRDPLAKVAYASVELESLRRKRLWAGHAGEGATGTLHDHLYADGFFDREAGEAPDGWLVWPLLEESWLDEVPGPVDASPCDPPEEAVERSILELRALEIEATRALVAALEELPLAEPKGGLARLRFRLAVHGARLETERSKDAAAAARWLEPLIEGLESRSSAERSEDEPLAAVPDSELADALLLRAVLAARASDEEVALSSTRAAQELGLEGANRNLARVLELRLLMEAGEAEEAVARHPSLPPPGAEHRAAHGWWLAQAYRELGRVDALLATVTDVLREPSRGDPVHAHLYRKTLAYLASVEFDDHVVAVLESMGPVTGVLARVEHLAEVALELARPRTALSVLDWLEEESSRPRPQLMALRALAFFLLDDTAAFRESVRRLVRRDPEIASALGRQRLSRFYAPADAALAALLRHMIPVIAEWEMGDPRRRRWLTSMVEETRLFLRSEERSAHASDLTELYRLAASMLEEGAPAYAARVGRKARRPLVLGTVTVAPRLVAPRAEPLPHIEEPYSLLLIPRDELPPERWADRWEEP